MEQQRIIECVPNFSEGRDKEKIQAIVNAIESVEGITMLDVDPGEATNRTVVTFVGTPEAVVEAAFRGVKKAAEVIDMSQHHGAHPRIGATDVLPLVPVAGVTLEECAEMARQLGRRIAEELRIPVYCYEAAAFTPERKNLAVCRKGEYEALAARADATGEAPDFGARPFDDEMARTGATVVGARDFLIAVNYNLNTTSTRRANAIAFDVREKGRPKRTGPLVTDKPEIGPDGKPVMIPGTLKGTKAIGWYIPEYGIAQVSRAAAARGVRVTGAEIVGLVPRRTLIEAGKHYLRLQQRSAGIPDDEIIRTAIISMGLSELKPFDVNEKIIENRISKPDTDALTAMTCRRFAYETASESPAPGGGSISAYMGALGSALATMVANLSAHKPGWDARWEEFSEVAEKGQKLTDRLLALVDEDTAAFNRVMDAFKLPKGTPEEKAARTEAIQQATIYAAEVPLRTMEAASEAFPLLMQMARTGNPASASDAGVGTIAARSAILGAELNVRINAASLTDREQADILIEKAKNLATEACAAEKAILAEVETKL